MNQTESKRKQIQLLSDCVACIALTAFGGLLGDGGYGYLAIALYLFAFFYILTSAFVPSSLGRLLRRRGEKSQYRNSNELRRAIFGYELFLGLLASVLYAIGGVLFTEKLFLVPYARHLILILSPILLLRAVGNVLEGVLIGEGQNLPVVVASVLRVVLPFGFGFLFGGILSAYGEKVSLLLHNEDFASMYGGVGIALALLLSELLVLLFLFILYRGMVHPNLTPQDGGRSSISVGGGIRLLYAQMGDEMLAALLILFPLCFCAGFYQRNMGNLSDATIYDSILVYGVFAGRFLVVLLFFILLFASGILPVTVRVVASMRKSELRYARTLFQAGFKGCMFYGLFLTGMLAVLSEAIEGVFHVSDEMQLALCLQVGSSLVLWSILMTYAGCVLWRLGKERLVLLVLLLSDVMSCLLIILTLKVWQLGIIGLAISLAAGSAVSAILLCFLAFRLVKASPDLLQGVAIPAGCVCGVCLLCFGLLRLLITLLGDLVTLLLLAVLGSILYLMALLMLRCIRPQELSALPGGGFIRMLGRLFHLM